MRGSGRTWAITLPAAAISFLVGFLVLGALTTLGGRLPSLDQAAAAPWWAWAGGVLGAGLCLGRGLETVGTLGVVTMIAGLVFRAARRRASHRCDRSLRRRRAGGQPDPPCGRGAGRRGPRPLPTLKNLTTWSSLPRTPPRETLSCRIPPQQGHPMTQPQTATPSAPYRDRKPVAAASRGAQQRACRSTSTGLRGCRRTRPPSNGARATLPGRRTVKKRPTRPRGSPVPSR